MSIDKNNEFETEIKQVKMVCSNGPLTKTEPIANALIHRFNAAYSDVAKMMEYADSSKHIINDQDLIDSVSTAMRTVRRSQIELTKESEESEESELPDYIEHYGDAGFINHYLIEHYDTKSYFPIKYVHSLMVVGVLHLGNVIDYCQYINANGTADNMYVLQVLSAAEHAINSAHKWLIYVMREDAGISTPDEIKLLQVKYERLVTLPRSRGGRASPHDNNKEVVVKHFQRWLDSQGTSEPMSKVQCYKNIMDELGPQHAAVERTYAEQLKKWLIKIHHNEEYPGLH